MQTEQDKQKVFVVDDEKTIALTLAAILSHSGFDATYYLDPLEALSLAKANPPQLVISDVVMPECQASSLRLRSQNIVLSAKSFCCQDKLKQRISLRRPVCKGMTSNF